MVAGNRFELEGRLGRILARPEALCLHPTLAFTRLHDDERGI